MHTYLVTEIYPNLLGYLTEKGSPKNVIWENKMRIENKQTANKTPCRGLLIRDIKSIQIKWFVG